MKIFISHSWNDKSLATQVTKPWKKTVMKFGLTCINWCRVMIFKPSLMYTLKKQR